MIYTAVFYFLLAKASAAFHLKSISGYEPTARRFSTAVLCPLSSSACVILEHFNRMLFNPIAMQLFGIYAKHRYAYSIRIYLNLNLTVIVHMFLSQK